VSDQVRGRRIAFVLDHPQRDLDGIVLTAAELCQRGAVCHLVPASLRGRELWALRPDFVVLYHVRRGFEQLLRQLGEARIPYGVLDNEGGVWPEMNWYTELLTPAAELRDAVRFLCAWGPTLGRYVTDSGMFRPDQVVLTGAPRFDLYHPHWRAVGAGPAPARRRILVNGGHAEANPRFGDAAAVYRHLAGTFGWTRERIDEIIAAQRIAMAGTIELARELARDFPEADVVLRPHPFEAVEPFAEAAQGQANLLVDGSGTIQRAILGAAVAIQRTSTTAIEACLAGVPAIAPMWLPTAAPMPIVESVSEQPMDYPSLRELVGSALAGSYAPAASLKATQKSVIAAWFHRIDGRAHARVADTIAAHLPRERGVDEAACERFLYGIDGTTSQLAERARRRLRFQLRLRPDWSPRPGAASWGADWLRTDQYFGAAEVHDSLARVLAARGALGLPVQPLSAEHARDRGDFSNRFRGHSVTIAHAAAGAERSA
jgi:surface carbohydrate biosynthesis protein